MAKLNKRGQGQRNRRAREGFIKWFLSDENMFATGSTYTIDGGQSI